LECSRCQPKFAGDMSICERCAASSEQPPRLALAISAREAIPCAAPRLTAQIGSHVSANNKAEPGERKEVSVLFADIKGSMELIAERDPEEAQSILDPALALMIDAVHRYDGTVCQVMGDGIMALFGAPLAQEDHAVRACHAALHLQRMIEDYATDLRGRLGVDVQVRVGLNSGEVVVRGIVTDVRHEYSAVGQTAHLAARMEQLARPGTILMTQSTATAVDGLFESRPLGPVPVKGLTEPMHVFELLSARHIPTPSDIAAAKPGGLSSFVGRDAEMSQIAKALDRVAEGRGQVIALVGDPGIGKSRLAYEVIRSCTPGGWMAFEGRALSYGIRTAFLPVASVLRAFFDIQDTDNIGNVRDKIVQGLAFLGDENADMHSAILWLLDIQQQDSEGAAWIELDPAVRRQRTIDAIKRLMLELSKLYPLILLIEDLHWIDVESQAVINALVEVLPYARILLMVTYRPEYEHSWDEKEFYSLIRVDPLPPSTMEVFALDLLGRHPTLLAIKQKLIEHTEGNPFFLEESVRSLAEAGVLEGHGGAYRLSAPVHQLSIPSSVKSVLAARIDRLSREDKSLLQAASVVGKDVLVEVLALVIDKSAPAVQARLEALQRAEFLLEIRASPREFTFKHALTHDVAYAGLLQDRRKLLHAATLSAMERLFGNRLAEHVEALARHAMAGEIWPRAANYLRQAGTAAAMRSNYGDAAAWHRTALEACRHLVNSKDGLALEIDIRFELYNALLALGDHTPIFGVLNEAERLAETLGDVRRLSRIHGYLAMSMWWVGDYPRAIQLATRAISAAQGLRRPGLEGIGLVALGWAYQSQGRFDEASTSFARVLELARAEPDRFAGRRGSPPLSVMALVWLATLRGEQGDFDAGHQFASDAVRMAEDADHPWSRAAAYFGLGALLNAERKAGSAIPVLERGLRLCESNDISSWRTTIAWHLGYARACEHDLEGGIPLLEEAVRKAEADRCFAGQSMRLGWLAEALLFANNLERASKLAQEALSTAVTHGELPAQAHIHRILGDIDFARQSESTAIKHYKVAETIARQLFMQPLRHRCEVFLTQERR
jgi:class 3 adenylate cyclase/tetratricopeptide (TPR) repeat protein